MSDEPVRIHMKRYIPDSDFPMITGTEIITADCGHQCYLAPQTKLLMDQLTEHGREWSTDCEECCGMSSDEMIEKFLSGEAPLAGIPERIQAVIRDVLSQRHGPDPGGFFAYLQEGRHS